MSIFWQTWRDMAVWLVYIVRYCSWSICGQRSYYSPVPCENDHWYPFFLSARVFHIFLCVHTEAYVILSCSGAGVGLWGSAIDIWVMAQVPLPHAVGLTGKSLLNTQQLESWEDSAPAQTLLPACSSCHHVSWYPIPWHMHMEWWHHFSADVKQKAVLVIVFVCPLCLLSLFLTS